MMIRACFLLVLPLVASLAGCGLTAHACTEIGCADGLDVDFQTASGTWPAGSYQIDLTADGATITCTTTLPFASATNPAGSCTSADVIMGLSGSAQPAAQHAISGLHFNTTPKSVKVTISRDGAMVASGDFTPAYETSMPNGPDCEPTCTNAGATLKVP
jgi:hypothetical protein